MLKENFLNIDILYVKLIKKWCCDLGYNLSSLRDMWEPMFEKLHELINSERYSNDKEFRYAIDKLIYKDTIYRIQGRKNKKSDCVNWNFSPSNCYSWSKKIDGISRLTEKCRHPILIVSKLAENEFAIDLIGLITYIEELFDIDLCLNSTIRNEDEIIFPLYEENSICYFLFRNEYIKFKEYNQNKTKIYLDLD